MRKYKIPAQCPVCGGDITVTAFECDKCGSKTAGRFSPCEFCGLSEEQILLVKLFLKLRGNIRDMEKEMGLSYPTIRNRLSEVCVALGLEVADQAERSRRQRASEILDQLSSGGMDVSDAVSALKDME